MGPIRPAKVGGRRATPQPFLRLLRTAGCSSRLNFPVAFLTPIFLLSFNFKPFFYKINSPADSMYILARIYIAKERHPSIHLFLIEADVLLLDEKAQIGSLIYCKALYAFR